MKKIIVIAGLFFLTVCVFAQPKKTTVKKPGVTKSNVSGKQTPTRNSKGKAASRQTKPKKEVKAPIKKGTVSNTLTPNNTTSQPVSDTTNRNVVKILFCKSVK